MKYFKIILIFIDIESLFALLGKFGLHISNQDFIEYIYDLTPDIDHNVRSHIDNVSVKKTIKTHHYIITISLQIKILNQTRLKLQM